MTTADAKVTKLTPEMQQAWVDLDIGFEPKEPLTISQCSFVRSVFFAGWSAALEAPHSLTEAITDEMKRAGAGVGVAYGHPNLYHPDGEMLAKIYLEMQAAAPLNPSSEDGLRELVEESLSCLPPGKRAEDYYKRAQIALGKDRHRHD